MGHEASYHHSYPDSTLIHTLIYILSLPSCRSVQAAADTLVNELEEYITESFVSPPYILSTPVR